jgi:hypothetical protein
MKDQSANFLKLLSKRSNLTHDVMAAVTGHSRSTAWRFCQRHHGVTIYISGWYRSPDGRQPSPLYSLMITGDEKDAEKPPILGCKRYRNRVKSPAPTAPRVDPVMAALTGLRSSGQ